MRRVQCAWCLRFKGADGQPVGLAMPIETGKTHGICKDCAKRGFPDPNDLLIFRSADLRIAVSAQPAQPSPATSGDSARPLRAVVRSVSNTAEAVGGVRPVAEAGAERKARISGGPGLLELRTTGGRAIRSVIYERSSPDSKEKARGMLVSEARALGYTLIEESEELLTGT